MFISVWPCDSSCFRVIIPMIYAKFDGEKLGGEKSFSAFQLLLFFGRSIILQMTTVALSLHLCIPGFSEDSSLNLTTTTTFFLLSEC